ncbi:hypothetical protein IWZ01DRAFT_243711 [Phyllosticta capitalensis]
MEEHGCSRDHESQKPHPGSPSRQHVERDASSDPLVEAECEPAVPEIESSAERQPAMPETESSAERPLKRKERSNSISTNAEAQESAVQEPTKRPRNTDGVKTKDLSVDDILKTIHSEHRESGGTNSASEIKTFVKLLLNYQERLRKIDQFLGPTENRSPVISAYQDHRIAAMDIENASRNLPRTNLAEILEFQMMIIEYEFTYARYERVVALDSIRRIQEHLRSTTANNLSEEDIEAIIGSIDIYDIGLGEASPPERDEGSDSGEMGEATTSPPNLSTEPDDVETRKTEDTDDVLLL